MPAEIFLKSAYSVMTPGNAPILRQVARALRLREGSNHRYVPVHCDLARSRAGAGPGLVHHRPPLEYRAGIRHCNYGHEYRLDTFIEALSLLAFEEAARSRADLDTSSAFAACTHREVEIDGRDLLPLGATSLLSSSGTRFKRRRDWSRRNGFCALYQPRRRDLCGVASGPQTLRSTNSHACRVSPSRTSASAYGGSTM